MKEHQHTPPPALTSLGFRSAHRGPGWLCSLGLVGLAALCAGPAAVRAGDDSEVLKDSVEVVVGSYLINADANFRLDSNLGPGTEVDFHDDLGIDRRSTVASLSGSWWIRPRHQLRAGWYQYSQEASKSIDRTIHWGDQSFDVGATVSTKFKARFPEVDYTYWVVRQNKLAVGVNAGVVILGLQAGLSLVGDQGRASDRQIDTWQPVPQFGGEVRGLITSWLMVRGSGGAISDFSGTTVWSGSAAIEPRVHKHIRVGLAYSAMQFRLTDSNWVIDAQGTYTVKGTQLYGVFTF